MEPRTRTGPLNSIGAWQRGAEAPATDARSLATAARRTREPAYVVRGDDGVVGVGLGGGIGAIGSDLLGVLPPLYPEWLGDRSFGETHRVRFPYVVGEMANGIATAEMVIAAARAGLLGFFGAAGLTPDRIARELDAIQAALGDATYGSNLIHSPHEPRIEAATAELYVRRGVRRVSASAFMDVTEPVVRYAATGLRRRGDGSVARSNHLFAKISRPEVATRFLEPAPASILAELARRGEISAEEAELAARVPLATDVTVEADSGGHTDNQSLAAVFPTVLRLRDDVSRARGYAEPVRVGAGGGIGTPTAVASAFSLGAAYVLTGSVNQAAVESGLSARGKELLAQARLGDVMMAPAADMFEMGVKVQVLKRGTLFAVRAQRLYEIYKAHPSLEAIPAAERARLEKEILQGSIESVWRATRDFFAQRAPEEIAKAEADPKHRMALVFRAYLGQSSKWAIAGDHERALDFQVWCGPAMGAFNAWVAGSFLEPLAARTVAQIGLNLLEGAAVATRAQQLRTYGVPVPDAAFAFVPRPLEVS